MNKKTILQLSDTTQLMYAQNIDHFNATRTQSWPGWHRCLASLPQSSKVSVLDIGCGNGRFYSFLRENLSAKCEIDYFGVDNNQALLQKAQSRNAKNSHSHLTLYQQDIVESLLSGQLVQYQNRKFDLLVVFGVLHHIPSLTLRTQFLQEIASLVHSHGHLWLSFWMFAELPRFLKKAVLPKIIGLKAEALEEGDYLLPWDTSNTPRFCHFSDLIEQQQLLAATNMQVIDSFRADGKTNQLNQYYLLQQT